MLFGAAGIPIVGRYLAQVVATDAGASALKARAIAGTVGNGLSTLLGAGFTTVSAIEACQAVRDLSEGKQGAGYALATNLVDAGAGASATAMAGLAPAGEVAFAAARGVAGNDTQAAIHATGAVVV